MEQIRRKSQILVFSSTLMGILILTNTFVVFSWSKPQNRVNANVVFRKLSSSDNFQQEKARQLVMRAIIAMGGEEKLRGIKRMQVEGFGHQNFLEQSERPEGPWLIEYRDFTQIFDFTDGKFKRTVKGRSFLSPSGSPIGTVVADGIAAYEFNGRFVPAFPSEVQDAEEWQQLLPDRALLTGLNAKDLTVENQMVLQNVNQNVVCFSSRGKKFRIYLNSNTGLPTASELLTDYPYDVFWSIWGDTPTRVYYSTWNIEPTGIRYCRQFDVVRKDMPYQSMIVTKIDFSPEIAAEQFTIPDQIKDLYNKAKSPINDLPLGWRSRGKPVELAANVIKIPAGWDVALVRQPDGIIVIEAPISSGYSANVIEEAQKRFPGMPIKAVITTSDAWPHFGGIREYVARGISVYALDLNRPILERMLNSPRKIHPDTLETNRRKANFHIVSAKTIIGDGPNRIEVYPIRGESSERMLMVYFPQHGLLYGSDLIQKRPDGTFFMTQYLSELADAVKNENLNVKSVFAMHAEMLPWTEITSAMGKTFSEK